MHYDPSAWTTAALITLMVSCWLMSLLPRCDHDSCRTSHNAETAKERKAEANDAAKHSHDVFHDRLRPQPLCVFCQAVKHDPPEPDPLDPES
jgi:hypothetical protein